MPFYSWFRCFAKHRCELVRNGSDQTWPLVFWSRHGTLGDPTMKPHAQVTVHCNKVALPCSKTEPRCSALKDLGVLTLCASYLTFHLTANLFLLWEERYGYGECSVFIYLFGFANLISLTNINVICLPKCWQALPELLFLYFPELESSITASDPLPLVAEDKKPEWWWWKCQFPSSRLLLHI